MSNMVFWAQLGQNIVLGLQLLVKLIFRIYKRQKESL